MFLYPYPSAYLYLCRCRPENVSDAELRFYFLRTLISHSYEVRTWTKCDSVGWSFMQTHSKQITFSTVIKCCACIFVHERTTDGDRKKERQKRKSLGAFKGWRLLAHRPFSNLLMMRPVMRKEPGSIFSDEFILYGRKKKRKSAAIKSAVRVFLMLCLLVPDSTSHLHLSEFSHQSRVNTYCTRRR